MSRAVARLTEREILEFEVVNVRSCRKQNFLSKQDVRVVSLSQLVFLDGQTCTKMIALSLVNVSFLSN